MDRNAAECLQNQLDVAGGGHDRRMMDAVLRQPRKGPLGQSRFEQETVTRDPVADQRAVRVVALLQEGFVVQHFVYGLLLVPRMSGEQVDDGLGPRILGGEIQGYARPEESAQGFEKADARIVVPHERRNGDGRRRRSFHTLRDDGLQGRVRCQLQHHIGPVVALHGLHRLRETDPLAHVRPPVGAVQPPRLGTRHRRDEGDVGVEGSVVEEGERLRRILLERVHRPGMKGDVARDQPVLKVATVQLLHDGPQVVLATAHDRVGRRVLAGDLDLDGPVAIEPEGNVQGIQQLLHARPIETDGQHAAGPRHALLQGGAMEDQARRVGERERARGVGRGHLARAVADHAVGMDAPRLEQLHQRALDHEDGGLGEPNLVELLLRGLEAGISQRGAGVLAPVPLDGVHGTAEDGMGLVEIAPATGPLRPLPGEHHDQPPLALVHRGDGSAVLREGIQRIGQSGHTACRERRARGEMGAAAAEIAGELRRGPPPARRAGGATAPRSRPAPWAYGPRAGS